DQPLPELLIDPMTQAINHKNSEIVKSLFDAYDDRFNSKFREAKFYQTMLSRWTLDTIKTECWDVFKIFLNEILVTPQSVDLFLLNKDVNMFGNLVENTSAEFLSHTIDLITEILPENKSKSIFALSYKGKKIRNAEKRDEITHLHSAIAYD